MYIFWLSSGSYKDLIMICCIHIIICRNVIMRQIQPTIALATAQACGINNAHTTHAIASWATSGRTARRVRNTIQPHISQPYTRQRDTNIRPHGTATNVTQPQTCTRVHARACTRAHMHTCIYACTHAHMDWNVGYMMQEDDLSNGTRWFHISVRISVNQL